MGFMEVEWIEFVDGWFMRVWFEQLDSWFIIMGKSGERIGIFCLNFYFLYGLVIYQRLQSIERIIF